MISDYYISSPPKITLNKESSRLGRDSRQNADDSPAGVHVEAIYVIKP